MDKRSKVLFLILPLIIFLSFFTTLNTAFSEDMTFNLLNGLNGISLPFENSGINNAEELCQSITDCESVSFWDTTTQSFVIHTKGSLENNFSLIPGHPYFVSVTQSGSWYISGTLPETVTFHLRTTNGTNINVIAIPFTMSNVTNAEELVNLIPNADTLWYWDAMNQGYVGHPKGSEINNFEVFPGYPYFVNVTADADWTLNVAFTVEISAEPTTGPVPLTVHFSAEVKGGTPPYIYQWDLDGNGSIDETRAEFDHIYETPGLYTVNLSVSDNEGNTTSDAVIITAGGNQNPVADAGGPYTGRVNKPVQFDGSGSYDPDEDSLTYSWDFGDEGIGIGVNPSHTYSSIGTFTVILTVSDGKGGIATAQTTAAITPLLPPTITDFSPSEGSVGTVVTITGTNFDMGGLRVKFNNTSAIITSHTSSSLTTTVPLGATTGPITITTDGGTAISDTDFTVLSLHDFGISVRPQQATAAPGGQIAYTVSVSGTEGFTHLVNLETGGFPAGFTGFFSPKMITAGQTATLYIIACDCDPGGPITVSITGTASISGDAVTKTTSATIEVIPPGTTTLIGRVLDTDGQPIKNVTVRVQDSFTPSTNSPSLLLSRVLSGQEGEAVGVTDESGNFVIESPPTGEHVVLIDGFTASTETLHYPTIPITMTILAGQTNSLPFVPHFHAQKNYNFTPINPTKETKVEDPQIPGFQMRIPAGVDIVGWDGETNSIVSAREVPIDALPVPPPPPEIQGNSVYMFYFGKQGGGVPTTPIPVTVPNTLGLEPGEQAELWYFNESPNIDEAPNEWSYAGLGTASADGETITTDPGVGIPRFCCGAITVVPRNPTGDDLPPEVDRTQGGDPVDLATGAFIYKKTDLVLPGRIPIEITRYYRSRDTFRGPYGVGTYFSYDWYVIRSGDMATLVIPPGSRIPFSKQADGSYANVDEPSYRGSKLTFNSDGTSVLRMKDGTKYSFERVGGLLVGITDRNGNEVKFLREVEYNVNKIIDSAGREININIQILGRDVITSVTDPIGRKVIYTYDYMDGTGRLKSFTDPDGGVTKYTYDSQGRMETITDARAITFLRNFYDANNRVCRQIQADGSEYKFYYITADRATFPESQQLLAEAASGGPITAVPCAASFSSSMVLYTVVIDPNGNPTTYRFNGSGRMIARTNAFGQTTNFEIEAGTNLTRSITDHIGRVTRFEYDSYANISTITDPDGNITSFEYEPTYQRLVRQIDTQPFNYLTEYKYDSHGNLTTIIDPMGFETNNTYDKYGQLTSSTNSLGNTTVFEYDDHGNLLAIVDPMGNGSNAYYDAISRLEGLATPLGRSKYFIYDKLSRLTEHMNPLRMSTQFSYDQNSNLLTVTDPEGNITLTNTYDSQDRLLTRNDVLQPAEIFTYDYNGNILTFKDRRGIKSVFVYDSLNRRTRADYGDGSYTLYEYDAANRLGRIENSISGTMEFRYDNLNRMVKKFTPLGTIEYSYDALGRRVAMKVSGQDPVNYVYDKNSRLLSITQGAQHVSFEYDGAGRRTALTLPNGITVQYRYDNADRITAITHKLGTTILNELLYTIDASGNDTSQTETFSALPSEAVATYDVQTNQLLTFNDLSFSYDQNGNVVTMTDSRGVTSYVWDARNKLSAINGPEVTAEFVYDPFGNRIRKKLNGKGVDYLYDGVEIVQEIENGTAVANYLSSLKVDEPFMRADELGPRYYLADKRGSIIGLANQAGEVVTQYSYDPFGRTSITGSPSANSHQYIGREHDSTGLYYFRARYYDPRIGRFIQKDPSKYAGGATRYHYAHNNPISWIDPFGLHEMLTSGGRDIEHFHRSDISRSDPTNEQYNPYTELMEERGAAQTGPGGYYENCHADAYRPDDDVWINDPTPIIEDEYENIPANQARPGDKVTYYKDGLPWHSGSVSGEDAIESKHGAMPKYNGPTSATDQAYPDATEKGYYRPKGSGPRKE
jgi:RHS repeat-associated protein